MQKRQSAKTEDEALAGLVADIGHARFLEGDLCFEIGLAVFEQRPDIVGQ